MGGEGPEIHASPPQAATGDTVGVEVTGLAAGSGPYQLLLGGRIVATGLTADAGGAIALTITIPPAPAGSEELVVADSSGVPLAATELTVTAGGPPAGIMFAIGGGLLAILAIALVFRRRNNREAASVGASADLAAADDPPASAPESPPEPTPTPSGSPVVAAAPMPTITPTRPWSRHLLGDALTQGAEVASIAAWRGALWLAAVEHGDSSATTSIMSSLTGIAWSTPFELGSGTSPRILTDHTVICVVSQCERGDGPSVWVSRDGVDWTDLTFGGGSRPKGLVTAAACRNGLVFLCCSSEGGETLWAGRLDGAWIRLELGFRPTLLADWSGRLMAFGALDGVPSLAESEAGIRWSSVDLDVPPSFAEFAPTALLPIADMALLLGTDRIDGVADAWVSEDGVTWDRAPLGAGPTSEILGGAVAGGAVLAAGNVADGAAVWRTERGIEWRRVEDPGFDELRLVDFAVYEGRSHVLGMDTDGLPVIWIRQPWTTDTAERDDSSASPSLQLVIDDEARVERPA